MDKTQLINLTKDVYRLTLLFPKRDPIRQKIREIAGDILADFIKNEENCAYYLALEVDAQVGLLEVAIAQEWTALPAILKIKEEYQKLCFDLDAASREDEQKPKLNSEKIIYAPAASRVPLISPILGDDKQDVAKEEPPASEKEIEFVGIAPKETLQKESVDDENIDEIEIETENSLPDAKNAKESLTQGQLLRQNRIVDYLQEKGRAQVWEIQKIFPDISKRTIRRDFRLLLRQGLIERVGERNKTYYKLKINIS